MERIAWTDERLDDLSQRMDAGFARVDGEIRELRTEMRSGFHEVNRRIDAQGVELRSAIESQGADFCVGLDQQGSELRSAIESQGTDFRTALDRQGAELRGEIQGQGGELRGEIDALRQTILRVGGGMMVGLVGVIAAVLARGV